MLLVDDILLAPVHGLFWILREIHSAAQQELVGEAEAITARLSELYMMLETGAITEEEFDEREGALLDRLDALQGSDGGPAAEDEDDDEEYEYVFPDEDDRQEPDGDARG